MGYLSVSDCYNDPIFSNTIVGRHTEQNIFPANEQLPRFVLQKIVNEMRLEGDPIRNLGSCFQMLDEPEVEQLMALAVNKNMADRFTHTQAVEIENRCVHMIANLWHAPDMRNVVGTSTCDSSEACMLAGLTALRRWRTKQQAASKPFDKPNVVCGPSQLYWRKFAKYWDVELRELPISPGHYTVTAKDIVSHVDENTIMVISSIGQGYTGLYEPIEDIARALDRLEAEKGLDIPLHVDATDGGFLTPFTAPEVIWDFRLSRVTTIHTSGHRFGLAPVGIGWVIWRDRAYLPEDLVFPLNTYDNDRSTFALNFSRPVGPIICQYYSMLRLGRDGYNRIHMSSHNVAQYLCERLSMLGPFEIIHNADPHLGIPCVVWRIRPSAKVNFTLYDLSEDLCARGWNVPAYTLPSPARDVVVCRIVAKQGFTTELARIVTDEINRSLEAFREGRPNRLTRQPDLPDIFRD